MSIIRHLGATLFILGLIASPVFAAHPDERKEIENLKKRIESLETNKEKAQESFALESLTKKLKISGLLELETFYYKKHGANATSDLTLSTAQLEVESVINKNIAGHIILLHEEDASESLVVDEAVLVLSCPQEYAQGRFSLVAGKLYLPFGKFNSHFINKPLTLLLGETNNTALTLGWASDKIDIKAGVFNGDSDTAGDNDTIDSYVVALEVTPLAGFTLGGSYISDLSESGAGLVQADTLLGNIYTASVPGAGVFVSLARGPFVVNGEFITAIQRFGGAMVAVGEDLTGARPSAWNLELAWMPVERLQLAMRAEEAHNFQNDLSRYGASASYGLFENTLLALEYLRGDAKRADNTGEDTITAQLAFEF